MRIGADERVGEELAVAREDALRAATIEGAYLAFEEGRLGSLEPGKLADLAVLSDDPLTCDEARLKDIRAELAQIVYEQPIYPKNLYAKAVPGRHADYKRDVLDRQVRLMQERGIWKKPDR